MQAVRKVASAQTILQYVQESSSIFVDRMTSGDISYDHAAGRVHSTSLKSGGSGVIISASYLALARWRSGG